VNRFLLRVHPGFSGGHARFRSLVAAMALAVVPRLAAQEKAEPTPAPAPAVRLESLPLKQVEVAARLAVKLAPADELAQFTLGSVKVLRSLETLIQDLNRHGFLQAAGMRNVAGLTGTPFPRLPGSQSQPLDYPELRKILERFQAGIDAARIDLIPAGQGREFKLPVDLMAIRFDLTGDGREMRTLPELMRLMESPRGPASNPGPATAFRVHFDRADALWLAAYTQFVSAGCDILLAHDFEPSFRTLGPSLFAGVQPLLPNQDEMNRDWTSTVADFVAALHQVRWECQDPARLLRGHAGLLQGIALSRQMMAAIQGETDDDAEWLPNERQHGVPGIVLGKEIQESWPKILDEAQAVLEGRKLLPHWRMADSAGIDVKKAFVEPRPFDLILWIQGQAAVPYMRSGDVSSRQTWEQLTRAFERGEFFLRAVYIN